MNKIYLIPLFSIVLFFGTISCKQDQLVLPSQIPVETDDNLEPKAPVKQGSFIVITDPDELVKFDLQNADREKVKTIFFSYNTMGEKKVTEVTNFDHFYIIENLPVNVVSTIEVWALGVNGLTSPRFSYQVTPQISISRKISQTVLVEGGISSVNLSLLNGSGKEVKFLYKIDNAPNFTTVDVISQTKRSEFLINELPKGSHSITYYIIDSSDNQSETITKTFFTYELVKILDKDLVIDSFVDDGLFIITIDFPKDLLFVGLEMASKDVTTTSGKVFEVEYYITKDDDWRTLQGNVPFKGANSSFQQYLFKNVFSSKITIYIAELFDYDDIKDLLEINVLIAQ